jgi:hypothetical protein
LAPNPKKRGGPRKLHTIYFKWKIYVHEKNAFEETLGCARRMLLLDIGLRKYLMR